MAWGIVSSGGYAFGGNGQKTGKLGMVFDCSWEDTTIFWLTALSVKILLIFIMSKGTPLHEILHLPLYWWRIKREKTSLPSGRKYAYGQHSRQYYLLFPSQIEAGGSLRVMIYFHGGAWRYGRPELFQLVAERFAPMGYTTVLPSCRRTPFYNYRHVREDMNAMMGHLARQFDGQAVQFVVGGMSSGGHLAAHLFYNRAALGKIGLSSQQIKGLLLLGAPLSLAAMPNSMHVRSFAGRPGSQLFEEAEVIHHVQSTDLRAVLCIHGEKDGLVPVRSAVHFFSQLEEQQLERVKRYHPADTTHLEVASWPQTGHPLQKIISEWLFSLD